jgi:hypothetical protein
VCVVLDEAEAAGRLLEAVEAHDEALDLAAFAEQLVNLLFGGVEGKVADVQRRGIFELVLRLGRGFAVPVVVAVAFASPFLGHVLACSCLYLDTAQCSCACRTFAVAYELGLSRRSMVLRRGAMVHQERQY